MRLLLKNKEEVEQHRTPNEKIELPGVSPTFTDLAIAPLATTQAIYHLAGRRTPALLQSVIRFAYLLSRSYTLRCPPLHDHFLSTEEQHD